MAVSAVPTSTASASASVSTSTLAGISASDFMNILIKQLQYQDPFEPMTNEEMVAQMATIRELEMNTRLSEKLESLTDQQRFASAATLIGKQVEGTVTDDEGTEYAMEGLVTAIRFTENGEVMLELDTGEVLPLQNLEHVAEVEGGEEQQAA